MPIFSAFFLLLFVGVGLTQEEQQILQHDALLFLSDLAFELIDDGGRNSSEVDGEKQQFEAVQMKNAIFRIDIQKCNISLNADYVDKFAGGIQNVIESKINEGIQKDIASIKDKKQNCGHLVDTLAFAYIYNFGYGLSKKLVKNGGKKLGVTLDYDSLEKALKTAIQRQAKAMPNGIGMMAAELAKYEFNIEKYSQIKNSFEEASNFMELKKIIVKKESNGDDLKWAEFAKSKNDTFGSFKDVRVQSGIFEGNKQTIKAHNDAYYRGELTYKLGLNHFADYCIQYLWSTNCKTRSRYIREYDTNPIDAKSESAISRSVKKQMHRNNLMNNQLRIKRQTTIDVGQQNEIILPESIDWRDINGTNYITEVIDKNKIMDALYGERKHCSKTSFAFAAASTLEGHIAKRTGKLHRFSAKQCMDCAGLYGINSLGECTGGWPEACFQYMVDGEGRYNATSGIMEWDSYPMKTDNKCQYNASKAVAHIKDWDFIGPGNFDNLTGEEGLKEVIATRGPVAASIVYHDKFFLYKGGVYYDRLCNSATGAIFVTIVGYGTDKDTSMDYWLIKNHWGQDWGENGYVRLARNKGNHCLILNDATYPLF